MKASFESLHTGNRSFLIRKFEEENFSAPYHYHPEFELTYIIEGIGKRYVGTNMQDYFPGDFVLLGANLPHCWKTDNSLQAQSVSVVIQFPENFMGNDFLHKPELQNIEALLQRSQQGISFAKNETNKENMLLILKERKAFKKLLLLLELLQELAIRKDYILLNKENSYTALSGNEMERINTVMAYIIENFQQQVKLEDAAATINMSIHAFCKYFKKITRKTFIEAVNDYRIDYAVKQLINTDSSIADIGYNAGFNDISNFHKTFKERTQLSPLGYRKTFIKKLI